MNQRDKRALQLGALGAVLILFLVYIAIPFGENWRDTRSRYAQNKQMLRSWQTDGAGLTPDLIKTVPHFALPLNETRQRLRFEAAVTEQLKKAGIQVKRMNVLARAKKQPDSSLHELRLQWQGNCKWDQGLNLLQNLYDNPHLVTVRDFQLTCTNPKEQQVEIVMTVSTFVDPAAASAPEPSSAADAATPVQGQS